MIAKIALFLVVAALTVSAQTNSVHNWTLKTGAVFPGDYLSSGTQMVVIKSHGTNCLLKISDLSTNDWRYFQECKAAQRQRQLAAEAELKQRVAKAQQKGRDAVAGIYECDGKSGPIRNIQPQKMDLRSDGTGITCELFHGYKELDSRKTTWSFGDNEIFVESLGQFNPFIPEGNDLIDKAGNRWFRIH
jgi:hypothetical protein